MRYQPWLLQGTPLSSGHLERTNETCQCYYVTRISSRLWLCHRHGLRLQVKLLSFRWEVSSSLGIPKWLHRLCNSKCLILQCLTVIDVTICLSAHATRLSLSSPSSHSQRPRAQSPHVIWSSQRIIIRPLHLDLVLSTLSNQFTRSLTIFCDNACVRLESE